MSFLSFETGKIAKEGWLAEDGKRKKGLATMETEGKKCACKGANLDRFIQPMILLIVMEEPDTGYGIFKKVGNFAMFREEKPDAAGIYRYLKIMEGRGLLEQYECREAKNKYKMKYSITEDGKACLDNWKKTLSEYAKSILELVAYMEKNASQP